MFAAILHIWRPSPLSTKRYQPVIFRCLVDEHVDWLNVAISFIHVLFFSTHSDLLPETSDVIFHSDVAVCVAFVLIVYVIIGKCFTPYNFNKEHFREHIKNIL